MGTVLLNKSHLALAPKDRNCEVFIYMATITPNLVRKISYVDVRTNDIYKYSNSALADKTGKIVSSDEYLYLTAERKKLIYQFETVIKELEQIKNDEIPFDTIQNSITNCDSKI